MEAFLNRPTASYIYHVLSQYSSPQFIFLIIRCFEKSFVLCARSRPRFSSRTEKKAKGENIWATGAVVCLHCRRSSPVLHIRDGPKLGREEETGRGKAHCVDLGFPKFRRKRGKSRKMRVCFFSLFILSIEDDSPSPRPLCPGRSSFGVPIVTTVNRFCLSDPRYWAPGGVIYFLASWKIGGTCVLGVCGEGCADFRSNFRHNRQDMPPMQTYLTCFRHPSHWRAYRAADSRPLISSTPAIQRSSRLQNFGESSQLSSFCLPSIRNQKLVSGIIASSENFQRSLVPKRQS